MILYLYNDHTAAAVDDRSGVIRTVPPRDGVLAVADALIRVTADGRAVMPSLSVEGGVHAVFTTEGGIRYPLHRPQINRAGVPVSCIEDRKTVLEMRAKLDAMEMEVERLESELRRIRGICERDALGFLITKKVPTEEEKNT